MNGEIKNFRIEADDFDMDKSHNGGSYFQPRIFVEFSDGSNLRIDDMSCGDFGARIYAEYTATDGGKLYAAYGDMLDDSQQYSEFKDENIPILEIIEQEFGYHIPIHTN